MSVDQLHYKSIIELSEHFRRGVLLPSEVTEATLSRIAKLDGRFHGYAVVLAERAMAQAKKHDSELAKGIWRGPLHGVPIGLKDLCYTTFAPTAGGTARGGHQGVDSVAVLLITPPNAGVVGGSTRPSSEMVEFGLPGVP